MAITVFPRGGGLCRGKEGEFFNPPGASLAIQAFGALISLCGLLLNIDDDGDWIICDTCEGAIHVKV